MSGELTLAIRNGFKRSATKLVGKEEDFARLEKQLDEAVIEENGKRRKLNEVEKKQIREEVKLKAGMAEDIDKYIKMSAEEFEAGLKKLQKANIIPENTMKYLDEALIYFNHRVVNGIVVQIADSNCVNVVQAVEDFLRTGKIIVAKVSEAQKLRVITNKYGGTFLTLKLETLQNKNYFKVGERGILYCDRGPNDYDHVLNVFMEERGLVLKDAQSISQEFVTIDYLKKTYMPNNFKLLKTKKK